MGEVEFIQDLLGGDIVQGVYDDPRFLSPGEVRNMAEVLSSLAEDLHQGSDRGLRLATNNSVNGIITRQYLLVVEAGRHPTQEDVSLGKGLLDMPSRLDDIIRLVMPVEVHGHDPGVHLADIAEKGKGFVLDPFHPQVDDTRGKPRSTEEVAEGKHPHRDEGDKHMVVDGLIVIVEFGTVNEEAINFLVHIPLCIFR